MAKGETQLLIDDIEQKKTDGWKAKMHSGMVNFFASFKKKENLLVLVYALLYVLFGVVNSLLLKKVMNAFQNYSFFLNQLTNYGYIPIFGAVVLYQTLFTKNIPREMRVFPWWKFLVMGILDALNGYFVVIGGIKTTGSLQQLLNQLIIPFTMVGSFFFLKERYTWVQIVGSMVIIVGVVVSLVPSLEKPMVGNSLFWNVFYLCQAIPGAASNIYKDSAFKSIEMDVWYLQFWDGVWQSIIGTFLFPINAVLPAPATIPFADFPKELADGSLCLAGHNIITPDNSVCVFDPTNNQLGCDTCGTAFWILPTYMAVNVCYNVFILLVIKYGSATILSIAQTIRLPLTNICFSLKFIMGTDATPFQGLSVAGLFIIIFGLVSYRVGSQLKKAPPGEGETGEEEKPRVIFSQYGTEVQPIHHKQSLLQPKSNTELRNRFFSRLGISPRSPLNN